MKTNKTISFHFEEFCLGFLYWFLSFVWRDYRWIGQPRRSELSQRNEFNKHFEIRSCAKSFLSIWTSIFSHWTSSRRLKLMYIPRLSIPPSIPPQWWWYQIWSSCSRIYTRAMCTVVCGDGGRLLRHVTSSTDETHEENATPLLNRRKNYISTIKRNILMTIAFFSNFYSPIYQTVSNNLL